MRRRSKRSRAGFISRRHGRHGGIGSHGIYRGKSQGGLIGITNPFSSAQNRSYNLGMSGVRLLVGTGRARPSVLTSDGKRERWDVVGRILRMGNLSRQRIGWKIRIGFTRRSRARGFGQIFSARMMAGKRVQPGTCGGANRPRRPTGSHHPRATIPLRRRPRHAPMVRRHATPWEFKRVLAPRAVAERSRNGYGGRWRTQLCFARPMGAKSWHELSGLRKRTGPQWQPGAGGMCSAHDLVVRRIRSIFVAISAAGAFRTDDGGKTWTPSIAACIPQFMPDPETPRSVIACTASRCIPRARVCSSCRSIGM